MSDFQLDTSGAVVGVPVAVHGTTAWTWNQLDAFTQGYVEALFADARPSYDSAAHGGHYVCGFSDIAPATMGHILSHCERGQAYYALEFVTGHNHCGLGRRWWANSPLTPHLGDDGLIYVREASVSESTVRAAQRSDPLNPPANEGRAL